MTPDVGAMFGNGASAFERVEAQVKSAEPTGDWTGTSSIAYALADSQQATRAADMSRADGKLQRIIADEAQQVEQTRNFIDDRGSELHIAILPALAALAPIFEPEGLAVSVAIQIAAVAATVPPATDKVVEMAWKASANARNIAAVADEYRPLPASMSARTWVIYAWRAQRFRIQRPRIQRPSCASARRARWVGGASGAAPLPGGAWDTRISWDPRSPGPGESPGLPGMSGGGGGAAAPGGGAAGGAARRPPQRLPSQLLRQPGYRRPGHLPPALLHLGRRPHPWGVCPDCREESRRRGRRRGSRPVEFATWSSRSGTEPDRAGECGLRSSAARVRRGGAPGSALGQAPVAAGPRPAESVAGAEPTDTERTARRDPPGTPR